MPGESYERRSGECRQLELLLQAQREALLNDDFDAVEAKSLEITGMVTMLQAEGLLPTGACLEQLRVLNEQLLQLLVAKRASAAADLETIRQKRDLNRSYRTQDR
jgi:hypothetical protein